MLAYLYCFPLMRKGFSLIELLLTLGIFILLLGVAGGAWGAIDHYRNHHWAQHDCALLASALEVYHVHRGHYPDSLHFLATQAAELGFPSLAFQDPWGHPYHYAAPSSSEVAFTLLSSGPDGDPGTLADNIPVHLF